MKERVKVNIARADSLIKEMNETRHSVSKTIGANPDYLGDIFNKAKKSGQQYAYMSEKYGKALSEFFDISLEELGKRRRSKKKAENNIPENPKEPDFNEDGTQITLDGFGVTPITRESPKLEPVESIAIETEVFNGIKEQIHRIKGELVVIERALQGIGEDEDVSRTES